MIYIFLTYSFIILLTFLIFLIELIIEDKEEDEFKDL